MPHVLTYYLTLFVDITQVRSSHFHALLYLLEAPVCLSSGGCLSEWPENLFLPYNIYLYPIK